MSRKHAAEDGEEAVAAETSAKVAPTFLPMENMVVNLADPGGERFAQIGVTLELADGRSLSGRIVSRDEQITRIATNLMRPAESDAVPNDTIRKAIAHPVSTMPSGLLNALNEDELLDLVAYLKGAAP